MGKFKKKNGKIEAEKVADLIDDLTNKGVKKMPDWILAAFNRGELLFSGVHVIVSTPNGSRPATPDDFIIQGTVDTTQIFVQDGASFANDYEVE